MAWWRLVKISMPLPRSEGYPGNDYGALGVLDRNLTQENANRVSDEHPDLKYLGNGAYGVAYSTGNREPGSVVVKMTNSQEEAEIAEHLVKNPIPCTIRVFSVQQIQDSEKYSEKWWKLTTEKVIPLSKQESGLVTLFDSSSRPYPTIDDGRQRLVVRPFRYYVERSKNEDYPALKEELFANFALSVDVYNKYVALVACLESNGTLTNDMHGGNIGKRSDGSYVLLDVGGLKSSVGAKLVAV